MTLRGATRRQRVILAGVGAVRRDRASAESRPRGETAKTWVEGHLRAGGYSPRHRCAARPGVCQAAGSSRVSIGSRNRAEWDAHRAVLFASRRLMPSPDQRACRQTRSGTARRLASWWRSASIPPESTASTTIRRRQAAHPPQAIDVPAVVGDGTSSEPTRRFRRVQEVNAYELESVGSLAWHRCDCKGYIQSMRSDQMVMRTVRQMMSVRPDQREDGK